MAIQFRVGPVLCAVFSMIVATTGLARQDQPDNSMVEGSRARNMIMAFHVYIQEHDDQLPPDLAAAVPYLTGDLSKASSEARAQAFRKSLLSQQDQGIKIPDNADERWIADNSSYSYIAGGGIKMADLADWDNLAVMHLKLDHGFPAPQTAKNPEGLAFAVGFIDSHVETLTRAEAEQVIADSAAVFEALRSGKPLPDLQQVQMDVRAMMGAIRAYAKAHADELAPDLGSVLSYIPSDSKRTATPKQRAMVFLLPEAKRTTSIPDEPTPEWVNEHTSYVYLGAAGAHLADIEDPRNSILIHGKLDRPLEVRDRRGKRSGFPLCSASGGAGIEDEEYARWIIDVSRRVVEFAKSGAPLPDHLNAYRDVRLILQGVGAFTKEHKGQLPADLGEVLPYILPEAPVQKRAKVFLSPGREKGKEIPESITPEWVNGNTSYTYLAGPGIDLKLAREAGVQVLLHGPLTEMYEIQNPGMKFNAVSLGTSYVYPWLWQAEDAARVVKESKETLDALKAAAKGK